MIFCRLWPDNVLKSLLSAVAVGYNPKINLADERRPLCLSGSQFLRCCLRGTAVRACDDDATEYSRARDRQNRGVELDRAD